MRLHAPGTGAAAAVKIVHQLDASLGMGCCSIFRLPRSYSRGRWRE